MNVSNTTSFPSTAYILLSMSREPRFILLSLKREIGKNKCLAGTALLLSYGSAQTTEYILLALRYLSCAELQDYKHLQSADPIVSAYIYRNSIIFLT